MKENLSNNGENDPEGRPEQQAFSDPFESILNESEFQDLMACAKSTGYLAKNSTNGSPTSAWQENLKTNQIGQYQIHCEAARGEHCRIYLAKSPDSSNYVAIRLIFIDKENRPFAIEATQYLLKQNHPNLVSVVDVGIQDPFFYQVTPFVSGQNLKEIINERCISVTESLNIFLAICGSIGKLHSQKKYHLGIIPKRIILDYKSKPWIAGWGLFPFYQNLYRQDQFSSNEDACRYVAPELSSPDSGLNFSACDVYSLGVLLFDLLIQRAAPQPLTGSTEKKEGFQWPNPAPSEVPHFEQLKHLLNRCLNQDPTARYPSASELEQDFLKYLNGKLDISQDQTKPSGIQRFFKWLGFKSE